MKKSWFSSKELTVIDGLPSTTQGVNRKARVDKWRSRKRVGVQGKAIEYHIESLPDFVKAYLKMKEAPDNYDHATVEPLQIWVTAYLQLSKKEQEVISSWLLRHGLRDLLSFINCSNSENKDNDEEC